MRDAKQFARDFSRKKKKPKSNVYYIHIQSLGLVSYLTQIFQALQRRYQEQASLKLPNQDEGGIAGLTALAETLACK